MSAGPTTSTPRPLAAALVASLIVLAAACSGENRPPPAPVPSGAEVVHFDAMGNGPLLEGTLSGRGKVGVILAHQYNADQSAWFGFAQTLADRGYKVLTFNFRGFCPGGRAGCSEGKKDAAETANDLGGAAAFMSGQGVEKLFLVGASVGGTASLSLAANRMPGRPRFDGVVALSAPVSFEGMSVGAKDLGDLGRTPKLFIAGDDDPAGAAGAAQQLYDLAPTPKQILIVPTDQHGAFILTDPQGDSADRAQQAMLHFLDIYGSAG